MVEKEDDNPVNKLLICLSCSLVFSFPKFRHLDGHFARLARNVPIRTKHAATVQKKIKGRFRKRAVLANVLPFWFLGSRII